jgi:hypothetical protein
MEWLALIVPVIAIVVLRVFFARKMTWWEFGLPILASVLVIWLGKFCAEKVTVAATEYWGGWMTKAVDFEEWDEEVPCRHPIYRTETYDCGTSKSPQTCTREVLVGYEHPYDVDDHPEHWQIEDSNGFVFETSQGEYNRLSALFHSHEFLDMHRNYHSINGNAYVANWNNDRATLQPVTSTHHYENRVAHATGIYHYPDIDKTKTPVADYPEVDNYTVSSVISINPQVGWTKDHQLKTTVARGASWNGSEELDKVNAVLGAKKKIRIWLIIWEGNVDRQVGLDQEAYWKGSNKNEIVICVNVKSHSDPTVNWCHVFSWSQSEELKTAIKSYVSIDNTKLDVASLATWLEPKVTDMWTKRNWHDFDFITVEPPTWAKWTIWILTILVNIGVVAFCACNDFHDGSGKYNRGYRSRY